MSERARGTGGHLGKFGPPVGYRVCPVGLGHPPLVVKDGRHMPKLCAHCDGRGCGKDVNDLPPGPASGQGPPPQSSVH